MAQALSVPVLFLSDPIVLPGMVVPIELDDAARAAVDAATASENGKLLIAPRLEDRYPSYGVLASIVQVGRIAGGERNRGRGARRASGAYRRRCQRSRRCAVGRGDRGHRRPGARGDYRAGRGVQEAAAGHAAAARSLADRRLRQQADRSVGAGRHGRVRVVSHRRAETPIARNARRRRAVARADRWTSDHLAEVEVNDKIAEDVREGMEKTQKEFLLRQQLAAIRKELGEGEPDGSDDYRAASRPPTCPRRCARPRCARSASWNAPASRAPRAAGSAPGWTPCWTCRGTSRRRTRPTSRDPEEILDADHHGLEDVKDRIVEYLAVRGASRAAWTAGRGRPRLGACVALAGPPGVGKTSLGESVARALGRKFVRVALGGVRDEAEIRGHRRTYVGALPGRIVRAIGEAGSMNPVVLLDEIDKVGSDYRGDPSAALLEVLDPAQNHTFRDHYLDLDLDLSDVVFLATANVIENIPSALLDRMELVQIDGYTEDDKVAIARDFLLPRQRERAALTAEEVTVTEAALRKIAADTTPNRACDSSSGCWPRRCARRPRSWRTTRRHW